MISVNVLDIVPGTSVDGPGLRTAIYMAGCDHACPGCHNPDSWNPQHGRPMTIEQIASVVEENGFPVTLTGGDPLCNPSGALAIAEAVRRLDLGPLWLYTGFTFEQALRNAALRSVIEAVDVVVDGPFVQSRRDLSLTFRGSCNQRIILVSQSLRQGEVVIWREPSCDF